MKSSVLGSDVIKIGAFCYCIFTEAVSIGSDWRDLFKPGGLVQVGQWGQCTIKDFQKAMLLCRGGKDNRTLCSGERK